LYMAASSGGERAAYYAIKGFSPLVLFGSLLLFLAALRRVFPDSPFARGTALALVALLPLFQLESCVVNNDVLAVFLGSLFLWLLVKAWNEAPSMGTALAAGCVMAAFVNTKATGWTLSPLWAIALHLRSMRAPEHRRGFVRDLAI